MKKVVVNVASSYANERKRKSPRHSGQLFNQSTSTGENRKKASGSLDLDELPI